MKLFESPSPAKDAARASEAALLNEALVDVLALRDFSRLAHWNVRGPAFGALHPLFGKMYEELDGHADKLAERVAMLGGLAKGAPSQVAESSLEDYPVETTDGMAHVRALADRLKDANVTLVESMSKAGDAEAENTYQLLVDVSMGLEQLGWMLLAHLQ